MQTDEYVKLAAVEDTLWHFRSLHGHVLHSLRALKVKPGAAMLDAGCGTGGLLKRLSAQPEGWRVQGLDYSSLACDFARRRTGLAVTQGSITELPFPDAAFDALVSIDVVCQVENPAAAFREFFRCLRPGGALVVNVPAYRWLWSYHDEAAQTRHRFSRGGLRALVREVGLRVQCITYWNTLLFPLVVLRRKVFAPKSGGGDVRPFPPLLDRVFGTVGSLELRLRERGVSYPYGSSVHLLAVKP